MFKKLFGAYAGIARIATVALTLLIVWTWLSPISRYNNLVDKDETVQEQWGNVESAYQRRADLIPNLVATVKGYASHEKETLEAVINARAKATQTNMNVDPSNMTTEQINAFMANQDMLTSALSKLMVVVEKYPELKANENFMALQEQLEGTENRINVERNKYNDLAKQKNVPLGKFPTNILNSWFYGFEKSPYFEAKKGSDVAPTVEF